MASRASRFLEEKIANAKRSVRFGNDNGIGRESIGILEISQEAFTLYESEFLIPYARAVDQIKERVNVLNGTQNATAIPKSAVRFQDMRYLKGLPAVTKSRKAASATPTKAEFDALHEDVKILIEALGALGMIIGRKSG